MSEHTPVLLEEVLAALEVSAGGRYLDATFGRGGHTAQILERAGEQGRVVAIDRDPEAIRAGKELFTASGALAKGRLTLVSSPFSQVARVVREMGMSQGFNGVLLDLVATGFATRTSRTREGICVALGTDRID